MPWTTKSIVAASDVVYGHAIQPVEDRIVRMNEIDYTTGISGHVIYVMRAVAETRADGHAASGQKVVTLANVSAMNVINTSTPETVAASDFLAWIDSTGKIAWDIVASVSSSAVTMTANFTNDIIDRSPVWIFGELLRASHLNFIVGASSTVHISDMAAQGGIPLQLDTNTRSGVGDPIIVASDNAADAGVFISASGIYADAEDSTIN